MQSATALMLSIERPMINCDCSYHGTIVCQTTRHIECSSCTIAIEVRTRVL